MRLHYRKKAAMSHWLVEPPVSFRCRMQRVGIR
jgi:hypothetical protein